MIPAFTRAGGFEHELRTDVIWQAEDFLRFSQEELPRLDPERVILG